MWTFIIRRFLIGCLTLFFIATLCFFITRFAPGNPFSGERQLSKEAMDNLKRWAGLDKSLLEQYTFTLWKYLQADFGVSWENRDFTVSELIFPSLKVSATLGAIAFLLAAIMGIPLGMLAASRHNKITDHFTMTVFPV